MFPFLQPAANTEKWDCFSSPQLNNEQFCESTTKDQEARPTFLFNIQSQILSWYKLKQLYWCEGKYTD